jgi:uncharacterized protein YegP (UPF0339 family)
MPANYVLKMSSNQQYYFTLTAENNEPILSSEMYKSRESAEIGISSVKQNAPQVGRYERKMSADGKHYFVLKAANHEVIGNSEMYSSEDAMENGIQAVMRVGPRANITESL